MLSLEERRFFRDQLRDARAVAHRDLEGFAPLVAAIERLGAALAPGKFGMGQFRDSLLEMAQKGCGAGSMHDARALFTPTTLLFEVVRTGRNSAVHEGAYARHLVRHCVELAIHIEDGLMAQSEVISDFMVRTPICAEPWHPVAFARQQMLASSFSNLPIWLGDAWHLLTDQSIASYLSDRASRNQRSRQTVQAACKVGELSLEPAVVVSPSISVAEALTESKGRPLLVVEHERLLGIATPFDFL
jgi:hypothetical protein